MANATLTSPCKTNQSETLAYEESSTHLRAASVSLYLNNSNQTFVLKNTGNPSPTIGTPKDHHYHMDLGRKKTHEDGEISVFTAEKYFNGGINEKTRIMDKGGRKHLHRKDDKVDQQSVKQKIKPRNSSLSSEAGSNSQNTLLSKSLKDWSPSKQSDKPEIKPRNPSLSSPIWKDWSLSEQKKVNAKRFFNSFGCKCTCTDEKSVDITKEKVGENKNSSNSCSKNVDNGGVDDDKEITKAANDIDQHPVSLVQNKHTQPESSSKEEISSQKFDNLGLGLQGKECFNLQVLNSEVGNVTVVEEKARKSLEVFGSPILDKDVHVPPSRVMEIPKILGSSGMFYDVESDSSSDLFEIKNLSHNFSTLSDNDEPKMAGIIKNPKNAILTSTTTTKTTIAKTSINKKMQRHRDSMLLSCRSHKAVKVVGNTYRIAEKAKSDPQMHRRSDSVTPMSEYKTDQAKVRSFKTERVRHSLARKSFS
ncbi:hypothetical protein BVC80_285g79 [Macleaya cordata]|uniref:Uncharacterized protein n=1 Tax=Macleaya cordata TaxID=56857 RepID=A0A200QSC2_MACCD|nr:hypothetical protein BVC80_285g79 [Macleaya cordata]